MAAGRDGTAGEAQMINPSPRAGRSHSMDSLDAEAQVVARRALRVPFSTGGPILVGLALPMTAILELVGYPLAVAGAVASAVAAALAVCVFLRHRETLVAERSLLIRRGVRSRRIEVGRGAYLVSYASRTRTHYLMDQIDPHGDLQTRYETGVFDADDNLLTAWGGQWTESPRAIARALGVPVRSAVPRRAPQRRRLARAAVRRTVMPYAVIIFASVVVVYGAYAFSVTERRENASGIAQMQRELRSEIHDRAASGSRSGDRPLWSGLSPRRAHVEPVYHYSTLRRSYVIRHGHVDVAVGHEDDDLMVERNGRLCAALLEWYRDDPPILAVREITVDGVICSEHPEPSASWLQRYSG